MSSRDMDKFRKEVLVTIAEIREKELGLKEAGVDIADPGEWQQLIDIIKRIERKFAQG